MLVGRTGASSHSSTRALLHTPGPAHALRGSCQAILDNCLRPESSAECPESLPKCPESSASYPESPDNCEASSPSNSDGFAPRSSSSSNDASCRRCTALTYRVGELTH